MRNSHVPSVWLWLGLPLLGPACTAPIGEDDSVGMAVTAFTSTAGGAWWCDRALPAQFSDEGLFLGCQPAQRQPEAKRASSALFMDWIGQDTHRRAVSRR